MILASSLILGAGLRLLYIDLPLADAHSWRQIENTTIARSFAEGPFDLLHPQVNWGGPGDASVEMEFPLLPAMIAGTYLVFGEHESLARLIVVGFSVGTIAVIYLLGRRLFGPPVGRAAAFLAAISPSMVYFGRSVIRHYFRPHNLDMTPIVFGALIDQTVGPDALLVATEYPEGSNSPILLYNARRQGWSFDGRSLSPHLLDYLLSRGGDIYFATTIWAEVEEPKPDVVAYLRRHRLVPLEGAPPNTRLIALR